MSSSMDSGCVYFCGADILLPRDYGVSPGALPVYCGHDREGVGGENQRSVNRASFRFGTAEYGAVSLTEEGAAGFRELTRVSVRNFIGGADPETAAFTLKAQAYANWSAVSKFCMSCGSPLADGEGEEYGTARVCPVCRRAFFPKISPAVIVLVTRGDEMLLAHNVKFPGGRHSLIAGFVEPGETLEETVHREVMEEAGVTVSEPRYVKSQPWPFPDSLMVAFEADYLSGEARPDGVEIDHLGWFSPESLPDLPLPGSIARYMVERFIASRRRSLRSG